MVLSAELRLLLTDTSADHVLTVIRHPMYVLERYVQPATTQHKLPLDLFLYKRPATTDGTILSVQEKNLRSNQFLISLCSKQPKICKLLATKPTSTDPPYVAISDDYLTGIGEGRITVSSAAIACLDATSIVLENGQRKDAGMIIFCTGYQLDLPFLDTSTQKALSFSPKDKPQPVLLHKLTFHPKLPNMAFVDVYRGPYWGIIELQARWACMVFSNLVEAPSPASMARGISLEQAIREQRPRPQFPHGNYVELAEDLAKEIGVVPDLDELKKYDPSLYQILYRAPLSQLIIVSVVLEVT